MSNLSKNRQLAIQIIEEFENLLTEKGISIPSFDRRTKEDKDVPIFGMEYYSLEDSITEILGGD